jgi:hypothetical protein
MQRRQGASPSPDVLTHAANALATSSHAGDAAARAGATAGGNDPGEATVGAGATGLVGNDGIGSAYGQPKKQSDPQWHASYVSMKEPQLPQLYGEQDSIQMQIADVISPHVGWLMNAKSTYPL